MSSFFDYFQAAALFLLASIFGIRTLHFLLGKRINPIALSFKKKGIHGDFELFCFAGLILWIVEVFAYSFRLQFQLFPSALHVRLIDALPAKVVGVVMVTAGFTVFTLALIAFGNAWRVGIDRRSPGKLTTVGIFAETRNPIYIFLDLYFAGTFLINGTLIFLLAAVLAAAALHYQILQEEKFLSTTCGQAYRDYCARTGRYLTWRRTEHNIET